MTTKRKTDALDQCKRVLLLAEDAQGTGQASKLIELADRWLLLADKSG